MILNNLFYAVLNWVNRPSTSTPLGQTNLNHMDKGILACAQYIVALSQDKAENATVNQLVKAVTVDTKTGIITVTQQNGSVKQYDLDIEKVVVNFDINDQNQLVLTLDDGTQKIVDLTRFVYGVDSTATVSLSMTNRTIQANIVNGSITMEMLDAAIQAEFRQYMLDAQSARDSALIYSRDSERWAIGREGDYPQSSVDNSKYYSEQAQNYAELAQEVAQIRYPNMVVNPLTGVLSAIDGIGMTFTVNAFGHLISGIGG